MDQDLFDLEQLRVDPERVAKPVKPKKWRRHYVRVPWQWVERLQKAKRVSTYRARSGVLYEHWRTGGRPIVLSNVFAHAEGLSSRSKSRAIAELEKLGLIQVQRHKRRAPKVVLKYLIRNCRETDLAQPLRPIWPMLPNHHGTDVAHMPRILFSILYIVLIIYYVPANKHKVSRGMKPDQTSTTSEHWHCGFCAPVGVVVVANTVEAGQVLRTEAADQAVAAVHVNVGAWPRLIRGDFPKHRSHIDRGLWLPYYSRCHDKGASTRNPDKRRH